MMVSKLSLSVRLRDNPELAHNKHNVLCSSPGWDDYHRDSDGNIAAFGASIALSLLLQSSFLPKGAVDTAARTRDSGAGRADNMVMRVTYWTHNAAL